MTDEKHDFDADDLIDNLLTLRIVVKITARDANHARDVAEDVIAALWQFRHPCADIRSIDEEDFHAV